MNLTSAVQEYHERRGAEAAAAVAAVVDRVPALRTRLAAAGVDPAALDVAALDVVAVLGKDQLPALQREHPPFGGLVADGARVERVFASPGPIYEAQLAGDDPWRWAPALTACGIGPGDVVLNCFGYHLSPAGMMFDLACRAVGATVVPGGVGAMEIQAQLIADLGVTAYIGLPSYLAGLVEKYDAASLPADRWRVAKALVTAEPLPDALRDRLRTRVPTVLMAYGTAEAGLIAHEVTPGGGLEVPEQVLVEICDPGSGVPVLGDGPGEVVVTMIGSGSPLVRFGTGDVSRWRLDHGRLRLAGVLGRVGAAVKVRGLFIHPHQASEVVGALREAGAEAARFVVQRPGDRDVLRLEVRKAGDDDGDRVVEAADRLSREVLRLRPEVVVVDEVADGAVLVDERVWA